MFSIFYVGGSFWPGHFENGSQAKKVCAPLLYNVPVGNTHV